MNHPFICPIQMPQPVHVHDFSGPCPNDQCRDLPFSIGRYNEVRPSMYTQELFAQDSRHIHVGIDLGAPAGTPVLAVADGILVDCGHHKSDGDYGPTLITEHVVDGNKIYCLYGHLAEKSLHLVAKGSQIYKGQVIGSLGDISENGGWPPHLHFQVSLQKPVDANLPGVVSPSQHVEALKLYPDPQKYFGDIY